MSGIVFYISVYMSKKTPIAEDSQEALKTEQRKDQPNQQNRGFEEDHPGNPVRTTGSTKKDQETLPTGEPDPGEA